MNLMFESAIRNLDLLAPPVQHLIQNWNGKTLVESIQVAEIDPKYMGGKDLCDYYSIPAEYGVNCILVEGTRGSNIKFAACLVPVNARRTDFNGSVRKFLNARMVSVAPLEHMISLTNMEYGSITVLGLPASFQILIDSSIMDLDKVVMGSGLQKSKLLVPTAALLDLSNVNIVDGLCS